MAYTNCDSSENYFDVIRGYFIPTRELREVDSAPDISLFYEGKDLVGVRIRNVFDKNGVGEGLEPEMSLETLNFCPSKRRLVGHSNQMAPVRLCWPWFIFAR